MIEHLDGIHETVTYKENSSLRLFVNTDCEDYPIHWHTPMEIIMPHSSVPYSFYSPGTTVYLL